MREPKAHEAKEIAEQVEKEMELFEAFLSGYVQGAQDMDSDIQFQSDNAFEDLVTELYRSKDFSEGWL